MSLINEALKKAHLEATSRAAAEHRHAFSYAPSHLPEQRQRRRPWGVVLGVVGAVVLVGVGWWSVLGPARSASEPAAAEPAAALAAAPVPEAVSDRRAPSETPPGAAAPAATAANPGDAGLASRPAAPSRPLAAPPPVDLAPAAAQAPPEPARPVTALPAAPAAPVPAAPAVAHDLRLDGIAWSENRALAMINGQTVAIGDEVDGFVVVTIARRQVELRGEAGTVLLAF